MIQITKVDKSQLEKGQVGVCIKMATGTDYHIKVGNWFPRPMQDFIEDHELYHTIDPEDEFWLEDEREANSYAFKNHPIGGIVNLLHFVVHPSRWVYYCKRGKEKK